ncbi:hypothetical protein ACEU2D_18240 [Brevibacillus laterosporus]|uniref:hypothetical protein n=1 Tax=Brevibacillus laterosporus TaxID=1465 RepID=UPI0035A71ABC
MLLDIIKLKCCICGELFGNVHPDHRTEKLMQEAKEKGYVGGDCEACYKCDPYH